MDGHLVRELSQDQGQTVLAPDLSGLHRQPHQAEHWQDPAEQIIFSGITEILQEAPR